MPEQLALEAQVLLDPVRERSDDSRAASPIRHGVHAGRKCIRRASTTVASAP
jgi:hypothetical protein